MVSSASELAGVRTLRTTETGDAAERENKAPGVGNENDAKR
jgi:hypothetical protein